jgi:hypothetical protein
MARADQIHTALDELEAAAQVFIEAIAEFKRTYTPNTVDLLSWQAGIEDILYEIQEDIEVELESR